eukprot:354119-Chlamydomonas_euryale.AAC.3
MEPPSRSATDRASGAAFPAARLVRSHGQQPRADCAHAPLHHTRHHGLHTLICMRAFLSEQIPVLAHHGAATCRIAAAAAAASWAGGGPAPARIRTA